MLRTRVLAGPLLFVLLLVPAASAQVGSLASGFDANSAADGDGSVAASPRSASAISLRRYNDDLAILRESRRGYEFWRHIFTIPDGSVAFGSAEDGRLIASFPARGDWTRAGEWAEPGLSGILAGERLPTGLTERRERVAALLEPSVGPVIHNATRGNFLLPNARRYGGFVREWAAIYERFGVPAEIGLAQAILESGWNGRIQSEARALGFCQWLPANWNRLKRLAHHTIEGYNQTTQAPYCAAYLTVLAVKYGSFIPALSEHHAGGTNVARAVITGGWLGGRDARESYLLGARFARDLREISPGVYRDIYGSYGPRSYLYAEMVFGNTANVQHVAATVPQRRIHAMRTSRAISMSEITRRTGLTADEVRRFNPALVQQVPRGANLYLPTHIADFGRDVSFWHRPASPAFDEVLDDFIALEASVEEWHDRSFRRELQDFERRFARTDTEEGRIMATVLAYVGEELYTSRRPEILAEYRTSPRIRQLFARGVREREALRLTPVVVQPRLVDRLPEP